MAAARAEHGIDRTQRPSPAGDVFGIRDVCDAEPQIGGCLQISGYVTDLGLYR